MVASFLNLPSRNHKLAFKADISIGTIFDKAAALMFSLVKNHPLVDGNKRLALATTQVFLAVNGYSIKAPQKERVKLALGVAKGERGRKAVARWLRRYALKIPDGYLR